MDYALWTKEDLRQAVETLHRGGVILYPTDTIWGLGCDATNADAVKRLFEIKHRAENKSMLVLVGDIAQLERTVQNVPEVAYQLIEAAVDPVTIIYDHASAALAPGLIAPDGSVGVRVSSEPFSQQICLRLRRPLVSTSANISGKKAPATFAEISDDVKEAVDYVVQYRQEDNSPARPSAIIKITDSAEVRVIR